MIPTAPVKKKMCIRDRSLAKEMPETVATAVAPALSLLMLVFTPLTWLFIR